MNNLTSHHRPLFALGLSAACILTCTGIAFGGDSPPFVPRQALLQVSPPSAITAVNTQYGTTTIDSIPSRGIYLVQVPQPQDEMQLVSQFRNDARIVFADVNYVADDTNTGGSTQDIFLARSVGAFDADPTPASLDLAPAHTRSLGTGVIVAVLDTGVDLTHPYIAGRVAPGGFDFLSQSTIITDPSPGRFAGHGTIIAGLILRVAPEATILPIRVMDQQGQSSTFLVARGIFHAIDNGASVVNVSLGTVATDQQILRLALQAARASNVLVIAAAGNDASDSDPRFPAGFAEDGVVGVTALNPDWTRATFSNSGDWIALSAPGVSIIGPTPGGGYGEASGTSFAAPLVAGVAALVKSRCDSITHAAWRSRLLSTAISVDAQNPNFVQKLGSGRVNAARAMGIAAAPLACDCRVDLDDMPGATLDDVFMFLKMWFSTNVRADFDSSGALTIDDIVLYMQAWFAGCP